MEIPYTVEERPDTGLSNGKFGTWLFLASEVMLFGALFSSYVLLRTGAPAGTWHYGREFLNVPLATLNTVILIASSVTMVMSWASLKMHDFAKYKMYMGLTFLCGIGFLIINAYSTFDMPRMYALLIAIFALAILANAALSRLGARAPRSGRAASCSRPATCRSKSLDHL